MGWFAAFVVNLWIQQGPTFFVAPMVENGLHPIMPFNIFLPLSRETQSFMFHVSKIMSFCHLHFNFLVSELISCYRLMALASWWTWSLLIPFKQIWFHMLFHLMLGDHNDCGSYIERAILYDWHPTHAFLIVFINVLTWHGEQKAPRPCSIDRFYVPYIGRRCW
jgi:hypothetical protein